MLRQIDVGYARVLKLEESVLVLDGRSSDSINCMPEYEGDFTDVSTAEFMDDPKEPYIVVW